MRKFRILGWMLLLSLLAACSAPLQSADPTTAQPGLTESPHQSAPAGENSPVWEIAEQVYFEESDDPPYEIDARWPHVEGDAVIAAGFNPEIDRRVNGVITAFLEDIPKTDSGQGDLATSTLAVDYDLALAGDGLVSVYLRFETYIAISAHPFPSSQALNYSLEQGRFLTLADLFLPEADPLDLLLAWVEPDLVSRDLGYTPGVAASVLASRANWNLLPEGLRLNFDVYEVGPYAAGPQYVLIPWGELAPFLDVDGPVAALFTD
ncbi:MAG: RsiV family protein [Brevefilum sp.]